MKRDQGDLGCSVSNNCFSIHCYGICKFSKTMWKLYFCAGNNLR